MMLSSYTDWMNYWKDSYQNTLGNLGVFNPGSFMSMGSFMNPVGQFHQFANPTDIFAMIKNFQSFSLANVRLEDIGLHPFYADLKAAVFENDTEKQREILKNISDFWCDRANFMFLKNIDMLTWQRDAVAMFLEKNEFSHFQNEATVELRDYMISLNQLFAHFIDYIRTFEGMDKKISVRFIDKVMRNDITVSDMSELFNIWSGIFEEYYREFTFGESTQASFALVVQKMAEVKAFLQKIIDRNVERFGLPSNREMDSVHAKLQKVYKGLRELQTQSLGLDKLQQTVESQVEQAVRNQVSDSEANLNKKVDQLQAELHAIQSLGSVIKDLQQELKTSNAYIEKLDESMNSMGQEIATLTQKLHASEAAPAAKTRRTPKSS